MKKPFHNLKLLSILIGLFLGVSLFSLATTPWVPPATPPPGGNTDRPINVSSDPQSKSGTLVFSSLSFSPLTASNGWIMTAKDSLGTIQWSSPDVLLSYDSPNCIFQEVSKFSKTPSNNGTGTPISLIKPTPNDSHHNICTGQNGCDIRMWGRDSDPTSVQFRSLMPSAYYREMPTNGKYIARSDDSVSATVFGKHGDGVSDQFWNGIVTISGSQACYLYDEQAGTNPATLGSKDYFVLLNDTQPTTYTCGIKICESIN